MRTKEKVVCATLVVAIEIYMYACILSVQHLIILLGHSGKGTYKVQPQVVAGLFDEWIMPLTKDVQVECLLRRFEDSN